MNKLLQTKPEETVSKAMCNTCYIKLIEFYEFKNVCIQSYKTLLGYEGNPSSLFTNDYGQNESEEKKFPKQEDNCTENKAFDEINLSLKESDGKLRFLNISKKSQLK